MEEKQSNFSILMFPWLAHGHIFPYLELAKSLSKKNFQIYFCSTSVNLSSIQSSLEKDSQLGISIKLVELQLPPIYPELPPHYHTTKNVPPELKPKLFQAFKMSKSSFSNIITTIKPDLLIYDLFQPWASEIASSLSIPAVHFATSGATSYSFFYHHFICKDSHFPYQAIYHREYEKHALKQMNLLDVKDENDQDFVFGHFRRSCEIVLMKTCKGVEGKYVDYLSALCKKKLVLVGPLIAQANDEGGNHSDIMEWLSKKSKFSTVFISFGSENFLSRKQIEEIAKGLEMTTVNFIWVIRFPVGETISIEEALPEGFLERVKDRGMVVQGWAPQAKILGHSSVGAFVSHCGMSSVLESVYFGVPVVALPLKLDQPLNARLLIEIGVGVEVERGGNGTLSGQEFANAINKVIVEKSGEEMRVKAEELKKKMKNEEECYMDEAVEQILRLCKQHNS
ncbi:hypothetical protein ACJIZ3_018187 [Penstemon smallii]|uniref:Glycosyltransferase n=1 Tax=Penstemon smallii TaxID=265156 RepID=A0ABD3SXP6_9LAMI